MHVVFWFLRRVHMHADRQTDRQTEVDTLSSPQMTKYMSQEI